MSHANESQRRLGSTLDALISQRMADPAPSALAQRCASCHWKASRLIYFLDWVLQMHVSHILPYFSWNGRPSVSPLRSLRAKGSAFEMSAGAELEGVPSLYTCSSRALRQWPNV